MSRIRTPLILLGLIGAVIVAVAVVVVVRVGRGAVTELPVAKQDIAPGTALAPQMFRLEEVRGLDTSLYVTKDEFGQVVGLPLLETVHEGFPVGKAQVRTDDPNAYQNRLTLLLENADNLVYPLPVTVDQAGNYIATGDYVDVIFTLGRVAAQELSHAEQVETPEIPGETTPVSPTVELDPDEMPKAGEWVTTTLHLPLSKVILPNVHVLRVEREQVRSASATYGEETRQTTVQGDVERLYVELTQEQAEVLSFAFHNGALNLPARAEASGSATEGYTWDDFEEFFFEGRSEE